MLYVRTSNKCDTQQHKIMSLFLQLGANVQLTCKYGCTLLHEMADTCTWRINEEHFLQLIKNGIEASKRS